MTHTVLVTGIGGNVGQGILRNIRAAFPDVRRVGTDIRDVTAGHHFCHAAYRVPYCYEPGFDLRIAEICRQEQVHLIIPGTDFEVVTLGELTATLPTVLGSPPDVARVFVDKLQTFEEFRSRRIAFAPSCVPSEYFGQFESVIVKPREGRGSRGIYFNPPDPAAFDDTHLVQEFIIGREITTAFYVTRTGGLHGHITFERELASGTTERCAVTTAFDDLVRPLVEAVVDGFDIRGPCNIQSIVTAKGDIVPFEVNCRYSGTNSIRSQFGFADVWWGLEEFLLHRAPSDWTLQPGAAVRVLVDIIYPGRELGAIEAGSDDSYIF
ncbi:MAG: ATP-grasp domain-containing protein [Planctomycetaceae bacterium]|nr:ATP-grasp domain-containing protein [Planctomycetaceae bacterium]